MDVDKILDGEDIDKVKLLSDEQAKVVRKRIKDFAILSQQKLIESMKETTKENDNFKL